VYSGAVNWRDCPTIVPHLIERPLDPHQNFDEHIHLLRLFHFADQFIEKILQGPWVISRGKRPHFSPASCRFSSPAVRQARRSLNKTRSLKDSRRQISRAAQRESMNDIPESTGGKEKRDGVVEAEVLCS
jgi:hypothetical protein